MKNFATKSLSVLTLLLGSLPSAWAQYSAPPEDAVIYAITSKGSADFTLASGATNSAAQVAAFDYKNPAIMPRSPIGKGLPAEFFDQILHTEPDNMLVLAIQLPGTPGPRRVFHRSYKTFITKGLVRETEGFTDFTEATGTTLAQGIDFGPDQGLEELNVLFWSNNSSNFPDFHIAEIGRAHV